MWGAYLAELLKLRRRPATWILMGVAAALVALFSYLFVYLFAVILAGDNGMPGTFTDTAVESLLPPFAPSQSVTSAAGAVAPVALILGVLASGSEYQWRTVRLLVTQRPSRAVMLGAKVAALATVAVALAVVTLLAALGASSLIAVLEGRSFGGLPVDELLLAVPAAALILLAWAALGLLLGTLFRGTGLAIGAGLVWMLVVEPMLTAIPVSDFTMAARRVMIGTNADAMGSAFAATGMAQLFGVPAGTAIAPMAGTIVVGIHVAVLWAATTLLFVRREIT